MNLEAGSFISSRLVSSSQKRQIMWNIIEPGDPYDIRKSMIARLPGRKNFMGDHLQLVCLLQAAEIQRLCEYLQQYKLKFREIERRQLDRHSYEIQIKELSQQLSQDSSFKVQNLKLKEFLRKQTTQFQELKKRLTGFDSELGRKYEDSLRQIEVLLQENQMLKGNSTKMRVEFQQIINTKTLETEELQRRLREVSARSSASEQKSQAYFKLEIEYKKLEFQNKRIKEIIDSKNREIEELQGKSKQFIYQIQELTVQLNQQGNMGHTLAEYQNRFALLGQELERLNLVLRQKTGQLNDITNKYRLSEEENRRKIQYIQQVQRKKEIIEENYRQLDLKFRQSLTNLSGLDESKNVIKTYEFNLQKLSGEIERLNNVLRKKVQDLDDATRRIGELDYEVRKNESVRKEVEDFRIKYSQFSKKIVDYEAKIALFSQEIERLNSNIKRKTDQNNYLQQQVKNSQYEIQNYQKRLQDLDVQYKVEINRLTQITRNYEININQLKHEIEVARRPKDPSTSPSKAELFLEKQYQSQIQTLNQTIAAKNTQISRYQQETNASRGDQDRQRIIQRFEIQLNTLRAQQNQNRQILAQYERRIVSSAEEINRLNSLLRRDTSPQKQETLNLKYENKVAIMNHEILRLNESLRNKTNENKNLELRLQQYQSNLQYSRKREIQGYLSSINELERKNASLINQNKKLIEELRNTNQKILRASSEQKVTYNANKQNELKIRQLYEENSQLSRKITEYQYQMTTLSNEIQRLNTVLKQKIDQIQSLQQKMRNSSRETQEYRRKVTQYEYKITTITKEHQLERQGLSKNSQYQLENTKRQCAELQRCNREYEMRINHYENQLRSMYQQTDRTTGQIKDQQKKFSQYQNKAVVLRQEIQRLNQLLDKMSQENTSYKKKVSQTQYLKSTIVTLEQKFSRAVQENDQLRKGASELTVTKTRLNQEYDFKVRTLTQQNEQLIRTGKEIEYKLTASSKEIQRLNNVLKGKVQDINNLESKLRSVFQQSEAQNRKIQQLANANRKIAEYENKISILSQEIERLNQVLKLKVEQIGNYQSRCRNYEFQINKYQRKIQDYENSINRELSTKINFLNKENEQQKVKVKQLTNEVNKIPELESKFNMVYSEVQRLNNNLKLKMQDISFLQNKVRNYQQEIQKYRRRNQEIQSTMHRQLKNQSLVFEQRVQQLTQENDSMRKILRELGDTNRKIGQYQNRMNILSKEIERLNELLAKYSKEVVPSLEEKLRNASYENEDLKRNLTDYNQLRNSYQELIAKYKITFQENQQYHLRVKEYENRMNQISGQIQRLNNVMRSKLEELNVSQNKLRQAAAEIESLNKKIRQFSDVNRKIPEMESHIALLSQQIQRLNSLLKNKLQENSNFQRELRRYKLEFQNLQRRNNDYQVQITEYKNTRSILQQKLSSMAHESQDLRKVIRQLTDSNRRIADYESRMALLSQEIQRLNMNLRMKIQELTSLDTLFKNYKRDSEVKLANLANQLEEQKKRAVQSMGVHNNKIIEYENKMVILSQEIQRLNYLLKEHTYEIQVLHKKQPQFLSEIQRLNNTLRLKVEQTSRWEQVNSELKARLKALEDNLHLTNQEYQKLKHSHNTLSQEYNRVNKHLVEYQQSINKLYQQFERLQNMLQELKKENYEYKLKLQQAGNLIEMNRALSAQIDRLTGIMKIQSKDLQDLRLAMADQAALQKRISEDMALMVVLFAEIQSLRKRVKQTEIQIETVRRSSLAPFKV